MALLSPITRVGTSVEDGWRESSRRVLLRGGAGRVGRACLEGRCDDSRRARHRGWHAGPQESAMNRVHRGCVGCRDLPRSARSSLANTRQITRARPTRG